MLRAGACTLVAVALMGGTARADVFVPDDPAPHDAACVAAAGDIVAIVRRDGRRWIVEISEAEGPWRLIRRPGHLALCPRVAAATDGTAVIALSDRIVVRRPGEAFGAPVALGPGVEATAVAAAPGGWTAAVGERVRPSFRNDLVATVVAPDGTTRSANLDRTRVTRLRTESFLLPRIGIDARGAATVVWTRWDVFRDDFVLRTSGTAEGMAWAAARTLSAGADASVSFPYVGQADVAVAPGGHTLLAWADGHGVYASVDGGPTERLSVQRRAGSPTATIADDGSAVVAYGVRRARVLAIDRGPDGLWTAPHELAGNDLGPTSVPELGVPQDPVLTSVLAPDGRVAVAWERLGGVGSRLVAASGRSGGAWTTAVPVSLITRDVVASSLGVAASGEPRLMWIESAVDGPADRLRGARLAPELIDRTAPTLTTRLPARAPRERAGHFTFAIPVSCSEACDARLRLLYPGDRFEVAGVVRELPAGAERIMRLRIPRNLARDMAEQRRRPWLQVLVTDREGNVARSSRRFRFR